MATQPAAVEQGIRRIRPYAPGWWDRLIEWIDRMPGSNPVYGLGLLVVQLAWIQAALWSTGRLPVGSFDLDRVFMVVVAPYLLWVRFHLDRVAGAALDTFRPVLVVGDAEFHRLRYELTTLPARTTWIITGAVVVAFSVNVALLPRWIVEQYGPSRLEAVLTVGPVAVFTLTAAALAMAQAIRQLWMVDRLHRLAARINLFRAKPLYAFSGLAARTGASFALLAYYMRAMRPDMVHESPAVQALLVAMIPTAVACFVLPLRSMHLRLVAEKERLLADAAARYEGLLARLHERVDRGDLTDADKLNTQMTSVVAEREALARISTWPWETATLTGFVTALVLPVLLWLLQRVLERFGL
jgi:hypothetical protein